ncbi:hypothetical protein L9F63_021974, partial [Diploptera punctata]
LLNGSQTWSLIGSNNKRGPQTEERREKVEHISITVYLEMVWPRGENKCNQTDLRRTMWDPRNGKRHVGRQRARWCERGINGREWK